MQEACGVLAHPPECLCDVVIDKPCVVATVTNVSDLWQGQRIAKSLDLCAPYSDSDLLKFFELQLRAYDAVEAASHVRIPAEQGWKTKTQKATKVINEFIADRTMAGDPSPVIRAEVERIYGVTMSASHMAHARRRLTKAINV